MGDDHSGTDLQSNGGHESDEAAPNNMNSVVELLAPDHSAIDVELPPLPPTLDPPFQWNGQVVHRR